MSFNLFSLKTICYFTCCHWVLSFSRRSYISLIILSSLLPILSCYTWNAPLTFLSNRSASLSWLSAFSFFWLIIELTCWSCWSNCCSTLVRTLSTMLIRRSRVWNCECTVLFKVCSSLSRYVSIYSLCILLAYWRRFDSAVRIASIWCKLSSTILSSSYGLTPLDVGWPPGTTSYCTRTCSFVAFSFPRIDILLN